MAAGSLLVGVLFIWLACKIPVHDSNTVAAMWLGILLAALGLAGIILAEGVVTTVYPEQRCLRIERRWRWGKRTLLVPFDAVASVNIARVGSHSDGTPSFCLQIERQDGKTISTGRWSTNQAEMRQLAERLSSEIGCRCRGGEKLLIPVALGNVAVALAAAVALYAGWFYFSVGPWCPAMWFGTTPPVLILTAFAVLLALLRRIRV